MIYLFFIRRDFMKIENNSVVTINLKDININDDKIIIGSNARVNIIGEINKDRKLEIIVGENSELRSYIIQNNGSLEQKNIAQKHARIYSNVIYFGNGDSKIINALEGDNSEAYDLEIFAVNENKQLAIDTILLHIGKNTSGNILVKGTAKDSAIAKVDGMIKIEKYANGANSFLDEHVMLLNPGARANTNPQLEIENNDVSSRHAASVAQIDENKLFYLQSRGANYKDARKLIVEGFLSSAIERIDNKEIREKTYELITGNI